MLGSVRRAVSVGGSLFLQGIQTGSGKTTQITEDLVEAGGSSAASLREERGGLGPRRERIPVLWWR